MKKIYSTPSFRVKTMRPRKMLMMSNLGSTNETSGNLSRDIDFEDEEDY